jgi:hypothetical protein
VVTAAPTIDDVQISLVLMPSVCRISVSSGVMQN